MQGQLRKEEGLTFDIQSECGHCGRPLRLEMDGAMDYRLKDATEQLLLFSPDVDWANFEEPNIIHAY